jgi:hypothetical protein
MDMSKLFSPVLLAAVLCLWCVGCSNQAGVTCPGAQVPEPEIVGFQEVPKPFSESTYFLYGAALEDGPVPILEELLRAGLDVRGAWYPDHANPGRCMIAILDQLIVLLGAPDPRILEFGFCTDSSGTAVNICIPTWEYYDLGE